jgi:nitrogen-specific signal transduction histidine kinase
VNQIEAKQIVVLREYAPHLPAIQGDSEHLYRAFLNLVANAVESMGARGRLTLRTAWVEEWQWPSLSSRVHRRGVKLEIEDTGSGISPAATDKIFNPFFTTKDGGTGLGLALVHKIIEDHEGSITFRSSPGQGTTFTVLLPVLEDRPAERKA